MALEDSTYRPTYVSRFNFFDVLNYLFLAGFAFLCLYPFIYVFAGAFSQGLDYMRGGVYFFPRVFTFDNFRIIYHDSRLTYGFTNTVLRTFIGIGTGLLFTSVVSYAMSRRDLPFRKAMYWFNLFTLFFSGGLIPYFLVIRSLGLIDSFFVYILPHLYSVFNMIVLSSFFRDIPEEIHESGIIDGAGEMRVLFQLYMPLAKPVLATLALWIGVFHWNSFFDSMVFTTTPKLQTLQLFLVKLIREAAMAQGEAAKYVPAQVMRTTSITTIRYAAIVVSTVPILIGYPFLQKFLAKGVMIGSLKG